MALPHECSLFWNPGRKSSPYLGHALFTAERKEEWQNHAMGHNTSVFMRHLSLPLTVHWQKQGTWKQWSREVYSFNRDAPVSRMAMGGSI